MFRIPTLHTHKAHDRSDIETKQNVRNLGVTLSCDGTFTSHINIVTKTARSHAGWILRTLQTHDKHPMLTQVTHRSIVGVLLSAVELVEDRGEATA